MTKTPLLAESRIHHAYHQTPNAFCADSLTKDAHGTILVLDSGDSFYLSALRMMLPDCRILHRVQNEVACELFFRIPVDIVLLDHSPENPVINLLQLFKLRKPSVPVLIMAEKGSESLAVDAFRCGARDYFRKPLALDEVERVLRALLNMRNGSNDFGGGGQNSKIEKPLSYIHDHFKSPLSLGEVAEKTGVSLSTLVRLIKKTTGMTFVDYVNNLRITTARQLLSNTSLTLLQISLKCGYNNQSHFNRVFKKLIGVSPGQYRKTITYRLLR